MTATRVHHLNFIVHDLERAAAGFERMLGTAPFETVDHAPRGAKVARTRLGDSWLVLVAPYDPDSAPGRFLAEHGEGFFLLSVETADLDAELARLADAGIETADRAPRDGILDWRVADIGEICGAVLQFTQRQA